MRTSSTIALILSIIALLISAASLGWQVYTWSRKERHHCTVTIWLADLIFLGETMGPLVAASVVNKGDVAARWVSIAFESQTARERLMPDDFVHCEPLPLVIPPRDSAKVTFDGATLKGYIDFDKPVVAVATLSTQEEFRSPATVLNLAAPGDDDEYLGG